MTWDKIQFFSAVLSLIFLAASYFTSVNDYKIYHTKFAAFKLGLVIISLAAMIVWFKDLAKYSLLFMIIAILSGIKTKSNGQQNNRLDNKEL